NSITKVFYEGGIFVYLLFGAVLSFVTIYIPARILSSSIDFKKLLVGIMYMNTFVATVSMAMLIFALPLFMFGVELQYNVIQIGDKQVMIGEPKIVYGYLILTMLAIWKLWTLVVGPAFVMSSAAILTGVSPRKIIITSLLIVFSAPLLA
ncbi:hypothetical protein, partial [Methylobacterium sp. WL12]|uniref:hypothetical protein n=1 Tax=Methylobacterium sp. WL12 TaxID=2603890 RepID=UPI001AED5EE9